MRILKLATFAALLATGLVSSAKADIVSSLNISDNSNAGGIVLKTFPTEFGGLCFPT